MLTLATTHLQDDGQEMICCDECEEWQHLPCHRHADALQGKPPQPYTDEAFQWVCARCRGVQQRRPRPPLPPPGTIPVLTYPPQPYEPPAPPGKRRASSTHAQQSAKKPKPAKVRRLVLLSLLRFVAIS